MTNKNDDVEEQQWSGIVKSLRYSIKHQSEVMDEKINKRIDGLEGFIVNNYHKQLSSDRVT